MKFNNIKHIFFDLDHTLWDFDKNSGLAFDTVFVKNKLKVELESFLRVYAPINANYWKLYRDNQVSQEDLRYGRLKETFDSLNISISDSQIQQISIDYIECLPQNNHLLEGAVEMLEYLKTHYQLHIITNGFRDVQHRKLRASGILKYFSTVTTSEDVGVKKPHKQIFEAALERAAAKCEESLMIGDNLEADILGAQGCGIKSILYNYYGEEIPSEFHQVVKMKDLANFL